MFGENFTYYNETLRKNIIAFGAIFNQVTLARFNSAGAVTNYIKVPINYGPKEKFVYRLISESGNTDFAHIQNTFPKMGYDIANIIFDPNRKFNRLLTRKALAPNSVKVGYVGVPYNINFNLYTFTRTIEDNLQLVEQIVPYFAPDFTVTIKYNDLNEQVDVPIVLNDFNVVEDYEADFTTRRSVSGVYSFTMKTYLYGQIKNNISMIIENANIKLYEGLTLTNNIPIYDFGYTGASGSTFINFYQN